MRIISSATSLELKKTHRGGSARRKESATKPQDGSRRAGAPWFIRLFFGSMTGRFCLAEGRGALLRVDSPYVDLGAGLLLKGAAGRVLRRETKSARAGGIGGRQGSKTSTCLR